MGPIRATLTWRYKPAGERHRNANPWASHLAPASWTLEVNGKVLARIEDKRSAGFTLLLFGERSNGFRGETFPTLDAAQRHALHVWERN